MSQCLVLIVLFCHCLQAIGQDCEYRYITQPPTELSCNPYDTINQFTLNCSVIGLISSGFSVAWFRKTDSSNTIELQSTQQGIDIRLLSSITEDTRSVSYSSEVTVSGLDETNAVGDYWCQVRLRNGTSFIEKSNILSLTNEQRYMGFGRCTGSQSINREDCLRMLNITVSVVTDGNTQTNTEPEVVTSSSSKSDLSFTTQTTAESEAVTSSFSKSDLSITTQTAAGPSEKSINLPAIYAAVSCIIVMLIILLLMCITIVSLRKCKLKTNNQEDINSYPDELETHELESSPFHSNQNEGFDYKANIAYDKLWQVTLNENVSYAATDSHRIAPIYEEIDDSRPSAWHGSFTS